MAEKGEAGEKIEVYLELKLLADIGLVGLPNAGKSTFLSVVSNARPEIADYPFTTLSPNLGVVDVGKSSLLIADIPGLIEGASEGKGLGGEFLRHIERTSVLVHLIDVYCDNVATSYKTIQAELKNYKLDLSNKPQVVALTKTEGLGAAALAEPMKVLKKLVPKGTKVIAISSQSKKGLNEIIKTLDKMVKAAHKSQAKAQKKEESKMPVFRLSNTEGAWKVEKVAGGFKISGSKIEKFARRTDFENEHGVRRLRNIMKKMGIDHELRRHKVEHGDIISFKGMSETITY